MLLITDGLPRGLGYYELDHRATPAPLPPGLRHFEADTYTWSHCQRVVVLNLARIRERYKCKGCSHHICDECAAKAYQGAACQTWAQYIESLQERDARPDSANIILP